MTPGYNKSLFLPFFGKPTDLNLSPDKLFSDRELDVLKCLAGGASNEKIAEQLFISVNTVKTHISNIYGKLEVNNRTEACAKAFLMGIIGLPKMP